MAWVLLIVTGVLARPGRCVLGAARSRRLDARLAALVAVE